MMIREFSAAFFLVSIFIAISSFLSFSLPTYSSSMFLNVSSALNGIVFTSIIKSAVSCEISIFESPMLLIERVVESINVVPSTAIPSASPIPLKVA